MALTPELWGTIARATLRAEGDELRSRDRLRCVNRVWHSALTGERLRWLVGGLGTRLGPRAPKRSHGTWKVRRRRLHVISLHPSTVRASGCCPHAEAPVAVSFLTQLKYGQLQSLVDVRFPVRRLEFHPNDAATFIVLQNQVRSSL